MTTIRRNFKNIVHNYSDAKVKVREATSNDPWGPSSTLMAEIAEMTYNVMAYTEIMSMIWKRLNDKNKNWRHVYKALVLLDYLIKTGSERVAQQCKENLFVIQSLRDFQYVEEARDHGLNVREKAKQLVALLKDDERLRAERAKALLTRERLHQGVGHHTGSGSGRSRMRAPEFAGSGDDLPASPGAAAAVTAGGGGGVHQEAEDIELQLALALSKEEHEQEMRRREAEGLKEDMKLRMALEASKRDEEERQKKGATVTRQKSGTLVDLIDTSLSAAPANAPDPWANSATTATASIGGGTSAGDPWSLGSADPWATGATASVGANGSSFAIGDPWAKSATAMSATAAPPPLPARQPQSSGSDLQSLSADLWAPAAAQPPDLLSSSNSAEQQQQPSPSASASKSVAKNFLSEHGNLVNLDSLVSAPKAGAGTNPFASGLGGVNPFASSDPGSAGQPTLAELQQQQQQQQQQQHHFNMSHEPVPASAAGLNPFL
ncbi:hypothetical protein BOX15_Mlig009811g1 [Macrostomum lignano]|uniref:ENTH domain-containing protein n=1 Tax=Macrostomum lignano TaxID=282301 RepID=A0A267F036_9PLAT|nr:hypothetical protein BOX15_Mlig009811g1 [Macrostomum lignano]